MIYSMELVDELRGLHVERSVSQQAEQSAVIDLLQLTKDELAGQVIQACIEKGAPDVRREDMLIGLYWCDAHLHHIVTCQWAPKGNGNLELVGGPLDGAEIPAPDDVVDVIVVPQMESVAYYVHGFNPVTRCWVYKIGT